MLLLNHEFFRRRAPRRFCWPKQGSQFSENLGTFREFKITNPRKWLIFRESEKTIVQKIGTAVRRFSRPTGPPIAGESHCRRHGSRSVNLARLNSAVSRDLRADSSPKTRRFTAALLSFWAALVGHLLTSNVHNLSSIQSFSTRFSSVVSLFQSLSIQSNQ